MAVDPKLLTGEELKAIENIANANDGRKPDVAALLSHIEAQNDRENELHCDWRDALNVMKSQFSAQAAEIERLKSVLVKIKCNRVGDGTTSEWAREALEARNG